MLYTNLTKKALKISFQAHKNQLDKSGIPYVYHPFHLAEQMDDEYSVCVALLHDVVEDTEMTIDDLTEQGFPREVTEALLLMTHDDSVPYMDYIKKIKTNSLATKVKLADLEHNSDLTRLDEINDAALERADKYRQAMFLLRSVERVERKIKVVPALETSCCHVKVPWSTTVMDPPCFSVTVAPVEFSSKIISADIAAQKAAFGKRRTPSCKTASGVP